MKRGTCRDGAPETGHYMSREVRRQAMDRVVKVVKSFEESDRADRAYYLSLTPHQRLEILWELNSRWPRSGDDENSEGLARIYRIVKFQ
jgi:hypothetical protein